MDVSVINSVAIYPDLQLKNQTQGTVNAGQVLNTMYFEMMLKKALSTSTLDTPSSSTVGLYSEFYMNTLVNEFAKNHELGFGQLYINNQTDGLKK